MKAHLRRQWKQTPRTREKELRRADLSRTINDISKIAVAAGLLTAAGQLVMDAIAEKRVRSVGYIERYEKDKVFEARQAINGSLRAHLQDFEDLRVSDALTPETHLDVIRILITERPDLEADIDVVVDFYDGAATCVREALCERSILTRYFGHSRAREFWRNFEPYIRYRRLNNPTYGEGLADFAEQADLKP